MLKAPNLTLSLPFDPTDYGEQKRALYFILKEIKTFLYYEENIRSSKPLNAPRAWNSELFISIGRDQYKGLRNEISIHIDYENIWVVNDAISHFYILPLADPDMMNKAVEETKKLWEEKSDGCL